MSAHGQKILVVGVGNVLQGDDGFGVELAWRLARNDWPSGVKIMETGIGGMSMVQELMTGYDALLVLDAHKSGGQPGEVRLLEPVLPDLSGLDAHALRDYFADTHYATPMRALALIDRLGRLPPCVAVLGCEPAGYEELGQGLSAPVAAALDKGADMVQQWVAQQLGSASVVSQDLVSQSEQDRRLYLIVAEHQVSPCNHEVFQSFKLWVAQTLAQAGIETYRAPGVTIRHWDEKGPQSFPHLLGHCDCGTYLPLENIDPGPMLASAPRLLDELERVAAHRDAMTPEHRDLLDALVHMTQQCMARNLPLEIR
ncbi:MAG: hydrogenase maturation protease [Betaproteobacteria bacterium]